MKFTAYSKRILADTLTPVSVYLKVRDRFPNSFLLESTDSHSQENSLSFICFNPIETYKVVKGTASNYSHKTGEEKITQLSGKGAAIQGLKDFVASIQIENNDLPFQNGLFGYMGYDSVKYYEEIQVAEHVETDNIPELMYTLFQNVLVINHYNNEAFLLCFSENGENNIPDIEDILRIKSYPEFSFKKKGAQKSNCTDSAFKDMVEKGREHCKKGDVFQLVLSRRFSQEFEGDEFNVYRTLRSVNPSPYLFYFDYGNFKIFGSSPESQIVVKSGKASINPIAGTYKRTGNDVQDEAKALELANDPKENAEHTMLVDLARNDLSTFGKNVKVEVNKEIQFFSHVIHLVSKVTAELSDESKMLDLVASTFPAGTLSGAPKYKAMQLIEQYENCNRQFYGGAIGFIGLDNSINHAIIIRSFMSRQNTLYYQAGAGVVEKSLAENELQEVENKLAALKKALVLAEEI